MIDDTLRSTNYQSALTTPIEQKGSTGRTLEEDEDRGGRMQRLMMMTVEG